MWNKRISNKHDGKKSRYCRCSINVHSQSTVIMKCDNQFVEILSHRFSSVLSFFSCIVYRVLMCFIVFSVDKSEQSLRKERESGLVKSRMWGLEETQTKEMGTKVLIEMQQQLRHAVSSSGNTPTSAKKLEDTMDIYNSIFLVFEDITYYARPWILSKSKFSLKKIQFFLILDYFIAVYQELGEKIIVGNWIANTSSPITKSNKFYKSLYLIANYTRVSRSTK